MSEVQGGATFEILFLILRCPERDEVPMIAIDQNGKRRITLKVFYNEVDETDRGLQESKCW